MSDGEIPATPADIRSLADQAEAEAAEAEALATAARARARAIELRREAEQAEARQAEAAVEEASPEPEPETEPETAAPETAADTVELVGESDAEAALAPVATRPGRWDRVAGLLGRSKRSTIAAVLAAFVVLGALAASGYMIKEHRDAVRQRQFVAEFNAAARQGVVTLTTLDFNNAKRDVQRILENATGTFKDDFAKTVADFTKVVEQSKVISQGTVTESGVDRDSVTENSAVVLLASTQEVTYAAGAK